MPDLPQAATISISKTLALLDGEFKDFADGVINERYAFWLGSGISFSRLPGLSDLVEKVLEFLRSKVDPNNENCPYRAGLERAFDIARLTDREKEQIDLYLSVDQWPNVGALKDRLSTHYSAFLNIEIEGEPDDFLIWEGIRVAETYGDPAIEPDAEHLAIAVLVKEGIVTELASANWDGLIEKALQQISDGHCAIDACVKSEDLQRAKYRAKLIKFHGCAIRARNDEAEYRPYIVGRQSQVDAWRDDAKMQGLIEHLRSVLIERPTLMLGLSAQDFNIRSLFSQASNALPWEWPGDRPAYVFAEEAIGEGQRTLLQNVYREHYTGENRSLIRRSAHIPAFAKPLLCALLLYAYAAKLLRLTQLSEAPDTAEMAHWLKAGIKCLRDVIAESDDGDHLTFLQSLTAHATRSKSLLLSGKEPAKPSVYEPISPHPVAQMESTVEAQRSGVGEAAVVAAIFGAGIAAGDWKLDAAEPGDPKGGIALLKAAGRETRVFVVATAHAEQDLFATGRLDETEDAIVIHSQTLYDRMQRSPRRKLRSGALQPRRTSIATLLKETDSPEHLVERFKMEVGI